MKTKAITIITVLCCLFFEFQIVQPARHKRVSISGGIVTMTDTLSYFSTSIANSKILFTTTSNPNISMLAFSSRGQSNYNDTGAAWKGGELAHGDSLISGSFKLYAYTQVSPTIAADTFKVFSSNTASGYEAAEIMIFKNTNSTAPFGTFAHNQNSNSSSPSVSVSSIIGDTVVVAFIFQGVPNISSIGSGETIFGQHYSTTISMVIIKMSATSTTTTATISLGSSMRWVGVGTTVKHA